MSGKRRRFGRVRRLPSGRFQVRYSVGEGLVVRYPRQRPRERPQATVGTFVGVRTGATKGHAGGTVGPNVTSASGGRWPSNRLSWGFAAYRKMAKQARIQGFRPGKVPPRIIDQRIGRGAVIEEAVQAAIPRFYGDAVRDTEVSPLGHPEVDVTTFDDGVELVFTAEVDVRPKVELPAYDGLPVTVDDAEVDDDAVDEQLASLRDRFSTLTAVDRPTEQGDFVSIDLSATVYGEPVPDGEATGLSYEVGSDSLLPGLDDALVGMTEGEARSFNSELVAGEYAGRTAQVAVTVRSVK